MRRALFASLLTVGIAACSSAGPTPAGSPGSEPPSVAECGPGTRPVANGSACAPVGATEVPSGFAPDGAWGFHAVLPDAPCAGSTIAKLGATSCAPIDDCAAAFPPPDAAIAVRAGAMPYATRPSLAVVATLAESRRSRLLARGRRRSCSTAARTSRSTASTCAVTATA